MTENRIQINLDHTQDELQGKDDLDIEVAFDIPVKSPLRPLAISGIIIHIIGLLLFAVMSVLLIWAGPAVWFNWNYPADEALIWSIKLWSGVLGLLGLAFLFTGLAFYTYGRTVQGGEDREARGQEAAA